MVGGFGVGGVLLYFNYAKARGNNRQENRKGRGGPGKARVVFVFRVAHTDTVSHFFVSLSVGVKSKLTTLDV